MEDFIVKWGAAIGIYILTGTLMQALNVSIGAKAGDPGFKGVWFVWRRWFIVLLGIGLGALAPLMGLSSPLGEGWGYSVLDGLVAAWAASGTYDATLKTLKARVEHMLAKRER
jgi:hypothetical protein